MKTIEYMGKEYEVKKWVKWVATDSIGGIFGYENKPIKQDIDGDIIWHVNIKDSRVFTIKNNQGLIHSQSLRGV